MQIIKENNADFEQFNCIKDTLILGSEKISYISKCNSCHSEYHHELKCNLLQYVPDIEKIIKRYEFCEDQQRSVFQRKKRNKFRTLKSRNLVKISSNKINKMLKIESIQNKKLTYMVDSKNFEQKEDLENSEMSNESSAEDSLNQSILKREKSEIIMGNSLELPKSTEKLKYDHEFEKSATIEHRKKERKATNPSSRFWNEPTLKTINITSTLTLPKSFIKFFEKYQSFEKYFPESNIENVISNYETINRQFRKERSKNGIEKFERKKNIEKYTFFPKELNRINMRCLIIIFSKMVKNIFFFNI